MISHFMIPHPMVPHLAKNAALISADQISADQPLARGKTELAAAALALLSELEASLRASQKALLARDAEGIEQGTREQVGLQGALARLWAQDAARPAGSDSWRRAGTPRCEPALAAALLAAQWRVLHLGRVQAGLLARAQRTLRMISNLLAGPEAVYGLPPGSSVPATRHAGTR
jgi:hypothetical protein